jgi:hypothetical protein
MTHRILVSWVNLTSVGGIKYVCGYCGTLTAPNSGYQANPQHGLTQVGIILICSYCNRPTYMLTDAEQTIYEQMPTAKPGQPVQGLPPEVNSAYDEARLCSGAGAHTGAVMLCRKLLMNVSVSRGAKEGETFKYYIEWLRDNHYTPPGSEDWVNRIRDKGNEATHKIEVTGIEDAKDLISFVEMLLKFIYEFPMRSQPKP